MIYRCEMNFKRMSAYSIRLFRMFIFPLSLYSFSLLVIDLPSNYRIPPLFPDKELSRIVSRPFSSFHSHPQIDHSNKKSVALSRFGSKKIISFFIQSINRERKFYEKRINSSVNNQLKVKWLRRRSA